MTLAVFLLALGATASLTRLVTDDQLTLPLRVWLIGKLGPEHPVAYAVGCPFCFSLWAAGVVYTLAWFYGGTAAFQIAAGALTARWIVGHVASFLDAKEG